MTVYIREAHAQDEWQMKSNVDESICYPQPRTLAQRLAIVNDFIQRFHFPLPISVDDMHETADLAYGGWPERIYIIDESGKVAYRSGLGPFNYHPEEARAWLEKKFGPTHSGSDEADAKN